MRRIDELSDIDLYEAEGVHRYCTELRQIYRDLAGELEFGAEALRVALGTAGGMLGWARVDQKARARRATAPLRRAGDSAAFAAVQVVKAGQLFRVMYTEPFEGNHTPAKKFKF
ncbi:hypothetical protein [Candidatus Frankia nodulisporulans]|uniref:hypothetical protein n=1 Tax=Candidatus Frankia nodulisporulans TaxID=2060052 RepID=UPI0013D0F316|nr:hypothetical protein [Candidatus Frankia nodulisporulans]